MSERGLPIVDAAGACPFVAFEDERDERSTRPDHRHRCYAESRPASRALAHQDAYCLSPAFPACPTFQDWARREAAAARPPTRSVRASVAEPDRDDIPPPPRRQRDWTAPPPWMYDERAAAVEADAWAASAGADEVTGPSTTGAAARPSGAGAAAGAPGFLAPRERPSEGAGLAESAALAAAGAAYDDGVWSDPEAPHDEPVVGPPAGAATAGAAAAGSAAGGRTVAPTSGAGRATPGRPPDAGRGGARAARRPDGARRSLGGPSWERPQHHEAYPTLKTRVGLPDIPGVALGFAALVVAALALFFIPPLVLRPGGTGGDAGASPTPSASVAPSGSPVATPVPSPTQQVYVIVLGDTLSTVATKFGLTLPELLAANPTIKNPDKIAPGQEIVIPSAAPSEVIDAGGASASPSAASP